MSSASRTRAVLVALRTWLLPVAIGAGAFGLHYALHVPAGPLPPPSPTQLEEQKKQAEKDKKEAERKQKEEDRKAGKVRPPAERSGARDLPYEAFTRPRSEFILAQLREYYVPRAFKSEPTFEAWQTAHKSILSQLVSAARLLELPSGPNITVSASECHTIRCRFTLSAPTSEALSTIVTTLETLELDGASIWFSFKPGKVVPEPAKTADAEPRQKQEIVVIFRRDLPPIDRIQSPGRGPLRPPPTTIAPEVPTSPTAGTPATGTPAAGKTAPTSPTGKPARSSTAKPSPTGATAREPDPTPK